MKKILIAFCFLLVAMQAYTQKYVFVDTDYILKNIPAFEAANEQLNIESAKWQKEIEALYSEV